MSSSSLMHAAVGLHILVAEDNRINTLVVSRLQERAGARVNCVNDAC